MDFTEDTSRPFYHIRVPRGWFRRKRVFNFQMAHYERLVIDKSVIRIPLNAGNMIYTMLCRLRIGDWEKQSILVASYRDLVYKMSYVDIIFRKNDMGYFHIQGQKTDVMWALSFMTQVYPDEILYCEDMNSETNEDGEHFQFEIQNGEYVGENAVTMQSGQTALPNIWDMDLYTPEYEQEYRELFGVYDSRHHPVSGESFVTPDGRFGVYIRMDERFYYAETEKTQINELVRHDISASLIKDFRDLISDQVNVEYEVYQMRYAAFMNKVHMLEDLMGGLEISCYDMLPIGERGLPFASHATITRTNLMDENSLKYLLEIIRDHKDMSVDKRKSLAKEASKSVISRLEGYDTEYRMYQQSGTLEEACQIVRNKCCEALYEDFVALECTKRLTFSKAVYKALCNSPKGSVYQMTEFERQKLRIFGRGYADYLAYKIEHSRPKRRRRYQYAMDRLEEKYLKAGV